MSLQDNHIDKLFKSKLQNQNFEVTDEFISDLEHKLNAHFPEKKKKRGFVFFSLLGALILFLGVTTFHLLNYTGKNIHIAQKQISIPKTFEKQINNSSVGLNKNKVKNNSGDLTKVKDKTINNQQDNFNDEEDVNTNFTSKNVTKKDQQPSVKTTIKTSSFDNKDKSQQGKVNRFSSTNKSNFEKTNQNDNLTETEPNNNQKDDNSFELKNNTASADDSKKNDNNNNQASPTNNNDFIQNRSTSDSSTNTNNLVLTTNSNNENSNSAEVDSTTTSTQNDTSSTQNPLVDIQEEKKHSKFGLMVGFGFGQNFYKPVYSGVESNYFKVNHSEKNTYTSQFNANLILRNHFLIGAGVGQNKFEYNYDYSINGINVTTDSSYSYDSTYVFDYYIYQQNVIIDTVYHYDVDTTLTVLNDTTATQDVYKGMTKASYIFIPLNIGYIYSIKRFIFDGQVNFRYHILQQTSGGYYSANTFAMFDTNTNPIFKKSYFDVSIKLGVHYRVWKQLYLSSALRFTPQQTSIYKAIETEKRIQITQLSFGLSYKF